MLLRSVFYSVWVGDNVDADFYFFYNDFHKTTDWTEVLI